MSCKMLLRSTALGLVPIALLVSTAPACSDEARGDDETPSGVVLGQQTSRLVASPTAGLIANPGATGQGVKSTFFFAGSWKKNPSGQNYSQWYEYPSGDNAGFYTRHPLDSRHLGWSEGPTKQDFAVGEIKAAGFNVVSMSFWGARGTDAWSHWAPMHTSTYAHDELFEAATRNPIFIQPVIESYAATTSLSPPGNTPSCMFPDAFPNGMGCIEDNVVDLVNRYIVNPANPAWPARWLRLYTRDGVSSRYAVNLFEVWSRSNVTEAAFAMAFDTLAQRVHDRTGIWVGFTLDVRTPRSACNAGRCPTAASTGPQLQLRNSVLAIQPFRSEIDAPVQTDVGRRNFKRTFDEGWVSTGIPLILDLTGGYDETIFGGIGPKYGNNDRWRTLQLELISGKQVGWSFSAWNGFTEGWAGMPTLQYGTDGTPQDTMNRWLRWTNAKPAGDCNYSTWAGGQPSNHLYGAICEKWFQMNASQGALGNAWSAQLPGAAGSWYTQFQYGRIYWSGATGAHEIHGDIAILYSGLGNETSWLGLPTTDELPTIAHCSNGRYNAFEHGYIDWCPGVGAWAHP